MNSQGKSIDFIRRSSSSDPLVRHAAPTPRSIPVSRSISVTSGIEKRNIEKSSPEKSQTSQNPPLKSQNSLSKPSNSSIKSQKPSTKPVSSHVKPSKSPEKPLFVLPERPERPEWPERPERPERSDRLEKPNRSEKPKKVPLIPYVEHIERPKKSSTPVKSQTSSPFIISHVEKRPLGTDAKASLDSILDEDFHDPRRSRRPDPVRTAPSKKRKSLPFGIIVLITIILGIAAGVGVYFLISD